jgi:hypothetical protein
MAVIINASTSTGLVQSADTSGVITLQNNGTNALTVDSGNLQFNSGYGSVATAYGCRAWVNFDASSGTPSIRGSGNVSSITDNGTGDFTVNFSNAMPDRNYVVLTEGNWGVGVGAYADPNNIFAPYGQAPSTSAVRVGMRSSGAFFDYAEINVAVFR